MRICRIEKYSIPTINLKMTSETGMLLAMFMIDIVLKKSDFKWKDMQTQMTAMQPKVKLISLQAYFIMRTSDSRFDIMMTSKTSESKFMAISYNFY